MSATTNKINLKNIMRKLRHRSVIFDLAPYRRTVEQINALTLENLEDRQLQDMSRQLRRRAEAGEALSELLVEAFALVREASRRILGMRPYDEQLLAGIVMHLGALAEMQTGEGKTLAAVLPVYLNALTGKGAHVLTFNDYLAGRDAEWMGPVYRFLGLSVGHVREGMSITERQRAYAADITYLTAREAGFDYLKSFLCRDAAELVQRPFHFALVDEADSLLIDEARIPMVIAGERERPEFDPGQMTRFVRALEAGEDYDIDEYARNVYLTDRGITRVEKEMKCGNLYLEKNLGLQVDLNNALHAEVLLKRDVDYIVRNGRVELVDEFTGRVAEKRHWPHGLQEAVEAKEGLKSEERGRILASVTMQNFIRLYPKVCGMTGTAQPAADEMLEFYRIPVVVIPTHLPCIRTDHPDVLFTHREAKMEAVVREVLEARKIGRPVLIGTCSVEESEELAGRLKDSSIECQVLNARNDELEAHIIARAGAPGAVTVSTNMAGRGTDIRLGGEKEEERERVVALGGLYVIGTNRHESRRIDDQLRGRAGRQGDPGCSRFFISLEDSLLKKYRIQEIIPPALYPKPQKEPLQNTVILKRINHAQRIIEGQNFDIRRTLTKYAHIVEQQRQAVFKWREEILQDRVLPGILPARLAGRCAALYPLVGEQALRLAEKQVTLYHINACWSDYLDYISYVKESIYLVNLGGKVPVDEFNRTAIQCFDKLMKTIEDETTGTLSKIRITREGADLESVGLKVPSATWTYLINDDKEQLGMCPIDFNPFAAMFLWPLMFFGATYYRMFRKTKELK